MQHMKAQGIRLGSAPYGYELSMQLDEKGRLMLVPLASEQEVVSRLVEAHAKGVKLNECQSPPPWDHPSPRIRDQGKTSRNRNGIYTPS